MSWGFANASSSSNASSNVNAGPDLEEIQTEGLGFQSLAGETKLRLLAQPWPSDRLPPPTASLLSVSSAKGLLAAAGPDTLLLASTDSVRQAYTSDAPAENDLKAFTPQATIPIPRVSQVSFSSDGSCLVIAAEEGGGLAIYDVQSLQQGNKEPAFQLATNGTAVAALVPNPAPENAHLFAVLLVSGQLLLANLQDRQLANGSQGPVFREGVSCVAWSAKGKRMVAGLQDGSAAQYDFQGNSDAQIPRPPQLQSPLAMTSICWLTNDEFFTIHSPTSGDASDSVYHLITRDKRSGQFAVQKFSGDPVPNFGERLPPHHFISRLRSFPPSLEDMIVCASTASTDVGVFTKSSTPLATNVPAEGIVNKYTSTGMANDARRAQLPMSSGGMGDTSPIGMAVDLSSKEIVKRPIPTEDFEETNSPLPAVMILNNEGSLSTWWVVYSDSIRQRTAYTGLTAAGAQSTPAMQSSPFGQASKSSTPASNAAPTPSAFGGSTFGKSGFGTTSAPGFGGASTLGARPSPFGNSPGNSAFGKPSFGSSTPLQAASGNAAFGAPSSLGKPSSSPFGNKTGTQQTGGATFGQPSNPFGGAAASEPSGFAKFGSQGGSAFAGASNNNASPFGAGAAAEKPAASPFAPFGTAGGDKPAASPFATFGAAGGNKPAASPFASFASAGGAKPSPFASFANQNQNDKPADARPAPTFGSASTLSSGTGGTFGSPSTTRVGASPFAASTNNNAQTPASPEATMMDDEPEATQPQKPLFGSATPKPPAAQVSLFGKPSESSSGFSGFKLGSGFKGDGSAKDDLPAPEQPGKSLFGSTFGSALGETAKEPATPIKTEPGTEGPALQEISTTPASAAKPTESETPKDAPLPPDFTKASKKTTHDDAPLPPDFVGSKAAPANDAPLPPDFTKTPAKPTAGDAPLPPDFTIKKEPVADDDLPPIAGSPPVDLGDRSPEMSPPEDSDEEDEGEVDEEEEEDEGEDDDEEDGPEEEEEEDWEDESGTDRDGREEGEEEDVDKTPQPKTASSQAASAFGSRLTFPSQSGSSPGKTKPSLDSTTPVGLPKGPVFAPPIKESPRSPSPIRSISTPAGHSPLRQAPSQSQLSQRPSLAHSRTSSRPASSVQIPKQPPPPAAPETTQLTDDEDERIRNILVSDIEPSKELEAFIAHQDYIGHDVKPGIGGQIENVFRDVNSMIDTLGLNARSLKAFVQGHEEFYRQGGRERSDLDDAEDWTLVEVEGLGQLKDGLEQSLESGSIVDARDKMGDLESLNKDTARLRTRTAEMRKQIAARTDPDKQATQRNAPLAPDTELQQSELRQTVSRAQELLRQTEDALSMLRADLASIPKAASPDNRGAPTVEAVTNTILKMTAMIEKKSGDVDVLEHQIRRLPHGLADLSLDDGEKDQLMRSSMRSSRYMNGSSHASTSTPRRTAPDGSALGMSGMLGNRFKTPEGLRRSMLGSTSSPLGESTSGSARKRMADVTSAEVEAYNGKVDQRRKVLDALREVVERKGTRVVNVQ